MEHPFQFDIDVACLPQTRWRLVAWHYQIIPKWYPTWCNFTVPCRRETWTLSFGIFDLQSIPKNVLKYQMSGGMSECLGIKELNCFFIPQVLCVWNISLEVWLNVNGCCQARWWFLKHFWNVHPENWGRWTHFDDHIFLRWGGSTIFCSLEISCEMIA